MPGTQMDAVTTDERALLDQSRRARFYADEDIEKEVVQTIRDSGFNIESARDIPRHRGKPDEFQRDYAKQKRRILLTKNGSDFWSDRKHPLQKTHSIVMLEGDLSRCSTRNIPTVGKTA